MRSNEVLRFTIRLLAGLLVCAGLASCSSDDSETPRTSLLDGGCIPTDPKFVQLDGGNVPAVQTPDWPIIQAAFHGAWSGQDVHALEKVYADDVLVNHTPYKASVGPMAVESGIQSLRTLIPDLDCVVEDGLRDSTAVRDADGFLVTKAALYTVTGTVSGHPIRWHGLSFLHTRLANADDPNIHFAEEVSYDDNLSFVTQVPGWGELGAADASNAFPVGLLNPTNGSEQRYLRGVIDANQCGSPAEEFKAAVLAALPAAYGGDLKQLETIYTTDCVIENSVFAQINGLPAFQQYLTQVRKAFPDLTMTMDEIAYEPNKAALHYTLKGTNTGRSEVFDFPPTGKAVTWRGVSMLTLVGGKIQKQIRIEDNLGLYYLLGQVRVAGDLGNTINQIITLAGI